MSCEDIPSLLDLQNTKKHVDDFGRLMGTGEGDSTNEVTGQVRPTYNKVMKSVGFKPGSGDFTTGFTVMPGERNIAWYDPVSKNWYSYLGIIPTGGYPVAPVTNPVGNIDWSPRTDQLLRDELGEPDGVNLVGGAAKQVDVDVIEGRIDTLEGRVDTLEPIATKNLVAAAVAAALTNGVAQKAASYGDSTGYGYKVGMPLPTDQVTIPPTLALQNLMSQLQLPLTVFNRCISSSTLDSMINGTDGSGSTFAAKVGAGGIDHDADIIYCNHAINDCAANSDISLFRSNLVTFVSLCRENGIVPVLVTPNPNPPAFSITEERSRRLVFFANEIRSVAEEYSVDLVDQYAYFDKSQKVENMVSMVPDGIHPSETMYVHAGQNLAIPIISSLLSASDVKGVTGISYKDNLTSRSIAGLGGRLGLTITATRGTQPQAMHIPVLFDDAAGGLSVYGSESSGEDKVNVQLNGFTLGAFTDTKTLGDTAYVDNDYRCMVKVGIHAGLQLITLTYDSTAAPGNRFTFSGISLALDQFQQITTNTAGSASKLTPISSGYSALTVVRLDATNELIFTDRINSPVVKIKNVSNTLTVELVANGSVVSTHTAGGFFSDGNYLVEMVVSDSSLIIGAGATGVSIPLTRKLPALFLYTKALVCDVR